MDTKAAGKRLSRVLSLGPTSSHDKHQMRIPLPTWQWTQCPQIWIRRTLRQVTSSFMMAAFTSHTAASSGSCWSNLCCFGYDIDPTHWKERVREAERESERASERRCIRWTCGQNGLLEASSKISLAKKLHSSQNVCFIWGSNNSVRQIYPSICLSEYLRVRWQFLFQQRDSRYKKFCKIPFSGLFLHLVHTLQFSFHSDRADVATFMVKALCGWYV